MAFNVYKDYKQFSDLFRGLDIAFGTGEGRWVKHPPRPEDWVSHLQGRGPGIGIAPLMQDSKVWFAAIDLDEPDFDTAREMQTYLPVGSSSFIERSRSGNAHVWVFFKDPVEAWIPMAILKEATLAAGKPHVEVFPKNHDFERVRLGNYINLPYHGKDRPILYEAQDGSLMPRAISNFIETATAARNDPAQWRKHCGWMQLAPPSARSEGKEFGTQPHLHICASYIISGEAGPITEGHRSVVYFSLAKMLTNWTEVDHDEVVDIMRGVNDSAGRDSIDDRELLRIIGNAERGEYTSTGCDDPLFQPFASPDCPIAYPRGG